MKKAKLNNESVVDEKLKKNNEKGKFRNIYQVDYCAYFKLKY